MTYDSDHGPDQINTVPRRNKGVHASQLHDAIHASFSGEMGNLPLFLRISHTQAQRLHISVKLRNRITQIVHFQNRQGSPLDGPRKVRSGPDQQRPIRSL